jgi:SAM-dependent methyltransferase
VVDVGGGSSALAAELAAAGMGPILVVDLSATALERSRARAEDVPGISWRVADVTAVSDLGTFDVWHDRAVFHFLTSPGDRKRYAEVARATVPAGGTAIVATFGPRGPTSCSGLPVERYDAASLAAELDGFVLRRSHLAAHRTPAGTEQQFLWAVFERTP